MLVMTLPYNSMPAFECENTVRPFLKPKDSEGVQGQIVASQRDVLIPPVDECPQSLMVDLLRLAHLSSQGLPSPHRIVKGWAMVLAST